MVLACSAAVERRKERLLFILWGKAGRQGRREQQASEAHMKEKPPPSSSDVRNRHTWAWVGCLFLASGSQSELKQCKM